MSQGAAVAFPTPGGLADGTTYNIPLQVNASALPTGVYPYTMTVSETFAALLGSPGIPMTVITTTNQGYVNVVNAASDPFGAGWSVGGLSSSGPGQLRGPGPIHRRAAGDRGFRPGLR